MQKPESFNILVIDDEAAHAEATAEALERKGFKCRVATSGTEGLAAIESGGADIILTDLRMQDVDGFQILRKAKETLEDVEVILMTAHGSVESAVKAMQEGAATYLSKPVNLEELRAVVEKAADKIRLSRNYRSLQKELRERFGFEGIVGNSQKMKRVFDILIQVAPTSASVLILGESGTGKELIARSLHYNSPRRQKPFVPLNCAALSPGLLESELFGHTKGAFTGAISDRAGKFEAANGGTLFLDELGDMPPEVQVKLLRTLESGEVVRVGENNSRKVDVRLVAATNKDLAQMVKEGKFREDLYFRLKVITIVIPPLRERKEDLPLLVDNFLREFSGKYNKPIKDISGNVRASLYGYAWPGNVRELRNVMESMVVVCRGETATQEDLIGFPGLQPGTETPSDFPAGVPLVEMERRLIESTLRMTNGNRSETARLLGIGERTLYRKIKEYDLKL